MAEQIENKVKNVARPDWIGNSKTIYDVSSGEVFWRNFVAGMGRALGGAIMYFLFIFVIYALFINYLLPIIKPFLDTYMNTMNLLGGGQQMNNGQPGTQVNQQELQKILQSLGLNN